MTISEKINLCVQLHDEAKGYYNAYEITGDQSFLEYAQSVDLERLSLEN